MTSWGTTTSYTATSTSSAAWWSYNPYSGGTATTTYYPYGNQYGGRQMRSVADTIREKLRELDEQKKKGK